VVTILTAYFNAQNLFFLPIYFIRVFHVFLRIHNDYFSIHYGSLQRNEFIVRPRVSFHILVDELRVPNGESTVAAVCATSFNIK